MSCSTTFFSPVPAPIAGILNNFVLNPILRPIVRLVCGLIAIPFFRFLLRKVFRVQANDAELERDLENWFRGAIIMLAATANLEDFLFGWTKWHALDQEVVWQTLLLRLLLAVGVIESMPDEDIFAILHRGPPKVKLTTRAGWRELWRRKLEVLKGLGILHLRRSSPVFLIMAVIFGDKPGTLGHSVGWWCYGLAITQYLIIALITQRDRFTGLLEAFDREAAAMREKLIAGSPNPSSGVSPINDSATAFPAGKPERRD